MCPTIEDGLTQNIITEVIDADEDVEVEEELGGREEATIEEVEESNIMGDRDEWENHMSNASNSEDSLVMAFQFMGLAIKLAELH